MTSQWLVWEGTVAQRLGADSESSLTFSNLTARQITKLQ